MSINTPDTAEAIATDERTTLLSGSTSARQEDDNDESPIEHTIIPDEPSTKKLILVLGSVYVGIFLGALDSTVIATLSAPIATSFDSLSLLSWLATAYLIANAACQPISGRLTDIYSRNTGLVVSNVLFAIGNLMCGLAQSEGMMIAGRIVAGMGGGGLMTIATFVASDLVPLRRRGLFQGIGNVAYGSGAGLGGLFGGWVNDVWNWRWAFLAQIPFVLISAIMVFFLVDVPAKESKQSKVSRVDFVGSFSLIVFLLLLLLGLNSGGNIVPWTHPLVLVCLPLSVVALGAFIWIEERIAKEPVIPVRLLLDRTVAASCLLCWFMTAAAYTVLFYIPIFFQVQGLSTTQAGLKLLPQSIGASIGSLGSGIIMNKTGRYYILGLAACVLQILGTALLATMTFDTPTWPTYVYMGMVGMGYGGCLTVTLLACIAAVDHEYQAVVTSATYAFRSTGSTIGVTIASAVYQNILKIKLWSNLGHKENASDIIRRIRDSFDELKRLPTGWKRGVLDSYQDAFRAVFLTAMGLALLGIVSGAFMRQHKLHTNLARK